MIPVQPAKNLSPEDYLLIEEEHLRLHEFLNDLQKTCCNLDNQLGCENCTVETLASCRGQLASFFYNFVNLSENHFGHEESIMRSRLRVAEENEYFRKHERAHAKLMDELYAIVSQCSSLDEQGKTAEGYRQLYKRMSELLDEHDRLFDDPFIESTKPRKISVPNGVNL